MADWWLHQSTVQLMPAPRSARRRLLAAVSLFAAANAPQLHAQITQVEFGARRDSLAARIGDGVVVGLGTVVYGEVPAGAIVGAAAWTMLGQRDAEHYRRLDVAKAYGGPNGRSL